MVIPRVIWLLWLQGWDQAPDIVRACASTWRRLNPGWDVRYLDRADVEHLFAPSSRAAALMSTGLASAALSDLVRLELLARHGGVWADATTYSLAPLDTWLADAAPQGFFAFDRPGPHRMLASWFLAAAAGSRVIDGWRARAEVYWRDRTEPDAYFWLDYLFSEMIQTDARVQRIWDETPKRRADGPRALFPYEEGLLGPLTAQVRDLVEAGAEPLLKLTHKVDNSRAVRGTAYRWLCERESLA